MRHFHTINYYASKYEIFELLFYSANDERWIEQYRKRMNGTRRTGKVLWSPQGSLRVETNGRAEEASGVGVKVGWQRSSDTEYNAQARNKRSRVRMERKYKGLKEREIYEILLHQTPPLQKKGAFCRWKIYRESGTTRSTYFFKNKASYSRSEVSPSIESSSRIKCLKITVLFKARGTMEIFNQLFEFHKVSLHMKLSS